MPEIKNKKRLIYTTEEFERTYLPKEIKELEIPAGNNMNDFGINLVKRIMNRIDRKV
jgi:hypothetical protein